MPVVPGARPMIRFLAVFCILIFCSVLPVSAARRVAIVIDQQSGPAVENDSSFTGLADTLSLTFGFDVIRSTNGPGRSLARDLAEFQARTVGSEIALVVYTGAVEHDRQNNFLLPGPQGPAARSPPPPGAGVNLDELIDHMVAKSQQSVILLEVAGDAARGGRTPGLGRMPVISDKLLISVSEAPISMRRNASTVRPVIHALLEPRALAPAAVIAAARDRIYLETAGINVMRNFGTLPPGLLLDMAPDRTLIMRRLADRIREVCDADFRKAPEKTERSVAEYYARSMGGLRSGTPLAQLDTFALNAILDELLKATGCPYAPAPSAALTSVRVPAPAAPVAPEGNVAPPASPPAAQQRPVTPAALTPPSPPGESSPPPAPRRATPARPERDDPPAPRKASPAAPVVKRVIKPDVPAPKVRQPAAASRGGGSGGGGSGSGSGGSGGSRPVSVPPI
jgi:uncharacterized membrane protein YgcG